MHAAGVRAKGHDAVNARGPRWTQAIAGLSRRTQKKAPNSRGSSESGSYVDEEAAYAEASGRCNAWVLTGGQAPMLACQAAVRELVVSWSQGGILGTGMALSDDDGDASRVGRRTLAWLWGSWKHPSRAARPSMTPIDRSLA